MRELFLFKHLCADYATQCGVTTRSLLFLRLQFPITIFAIEARENEGYHQQRNRTKDAGLGADNPAGEPSWPSECRMEHTVVWGDAAVGNSVETILSPVPAGVKANGHPEAARPPQK
jgi:hypothetical protein